MAHAHSVAQGEPASPTFELYHENSKQRRNDLAFARRIHYVNHSPDLHRVIARAFKRYPGAAAVPLPVVPAPTAPGFGRTASRRRSTRRYTEDPLALGDLATLLHFASGLTGALDPPDGGVPQPVRAAPSAGALYPVETYVVVSRVDGLESGIYHYAVDRHALELLRPGGYAEALIGATTDPAFGRAAAIVVLTGLFGRAHFKYGERGYRFALFEAGHVCQSLLLAATDLGLGATPVGGFIDDEVNDLIELDGVDEAVLYLIPVGHPAAAPVDDTGRGSPVDRLLATLWSDGLAGDGGPSGERGAEEPEDR